MLISIEGHSVADFDTQSAFNRWQTTTFKASWILSTLYNYHLDGPAIREPNLEIDDWHSYHDGIVWYQWLYAGCQATSDQNYIGK